MPFVDTRAGRLAYAEAGRDSAGPPLLLLHANLHDRHDFDAVVPRLARQYRTIALDWPSHGESDRPPGEPGAGLLADALVDVVETLDLPPALLIGNSVGGLAAARLAITHPDRVAGLVLVNTGGFAPMNPVTRAFCRLLGMPSVARRVLPSLVSSYLRPQSDSDRAIQAKVRARTRTADGAATAAALWRSFAEPENDLRERAAELTAPTLIVWGSRDPVNPLRLGRRVPRYIRGARFEVLPTGHVPFSSQPEEFCAVVEPFLAASAHV